MNQVDQQEHLRRQVLSRSLSQADRQETLRLERAARQALQKRSKPVKEELPPVPVIPAFQAPVIEEEEEQRVDVTEELRRVSAEYQGYLEGLVERTPETAEERYFKAH